jgi:hypothetical protein
VPSALEVTDAQLPLSKPVASDQVCPESFEVKIPPGSLFVATSLVPSALEAIDDQPAFPADSLICQVSPESFEV